MAPKSVDIPSFTATQLVLLTAELDAELTETSQLASQSSPAALQRAGLAILNLHVASQRTGLGGKTVFELEIDPSIGGELPEHGLRVGDIVGIKEQVSGSVKKKEKSEVDKREIDGVVVKVASAALCVAADKEEVDIPSGRLWVIKLANDVTYKRMNQTMERMGKLSEAQQSTFIQTLFGKTSPTPIPANLDGAVGEIKWVSQSLNDTQKEAIRFALASKEIGLIHGPPGTGKTHTLIELILQLLKQNLRLLVCGPSNTSVDNIVERLAPHKVPMVRLGHPARLHPSVLNHSLDILTKTSEAAALVQDVRKEMDGKQASIKKTRNGRERKAIYGELRELRKEYRERERGCVDSLIRGSKVVLSTLHGSGGYQLRQAQFDVVIIDEASQALEAQCWVALLAAKKAILAGDHLQLPPTIKSTNSKAKSNPKATKNRLADANDSTKHEVVFDEKLAEAGKSEEAPPEKAVVQKAVTLETTLFDRLLSLHGNGIKRMLTIQYRMHDKINAFPSKELYESKLVSDDSVKTHVLSDLPGVAQTEDTTEALIFYDTQGGDFPEKAEDDELEKKFRRSMAESKSNEREIALIAAYVMKLTDAGVRAEDIAVITPYNAQLSLLSRSLKETVPGIELGSVDGFQGREKEVVIFSMVRSNEEGEVGFLAEKRRLNGMLAGHYSIANTVHPVPEPCMPSADFRRIVAMTRPRRQLVIVGDSDTISKGSGYLKRWMAFLENHADLRYPNPSELIAR